MRGDVGVPVRLRYRKRGRVRFISHRDVARAFERAVRIERLPLSFTGGFSPRPKVSFGLALPVGHESDAEYLDLELAEAVALDGLVAGLCDALPDGIDVTGAAYLAERAPSLQEAVTAAGYRVEVDGAPDVVAGLPGRVAAALAADRLDGVRRRKGTETVDDLRPAILACEVVEPAVLALELATQPRGVRPAEVLHVLDGDLTEVAVVRTHQWIERDGARHEPLDADTRPHAMERAS